MFGSNEAPLDFPEDTYGSVKRIRVFKQWVEAFRTSVQGRRLAILDYGCGTGARVTVPLARAGDAVHGVDVHSGSIEAAKRTWQLENVTFSTESTRELLDSGVRFDIIVCSEVLEHLTDPGVILRDFRELLNPGGELFVTVPNGYGAFENLKRVEKILDRMGVGRALAELRWLLRAIKWHRQGKGRPARPGLDARMDAEQGYLNFESGHVQFFRLPALEHLFRRCGFEVVESRGRTFVCGPYADFLLAHLSFGGRLLELNNRLGDELPLYTTAGWMFRLRHMNVH